MTDFTFLYFLLFKAHFLPLYFLKSLYKFKHFAKVYILENTSAEMWQQIPYTLARLLSLQVCVNNHKPPAL